MDSIKKILILPYFGEFNEYFQLWLNSCAKNKNTDWLLITDVDIEYNIPENVRVIKKTFLEVKTLFQQKFGFNIVLDKPYKLCDYKQYYGFLFEEYITKYEFWGYCDCDLIFGDIETFLEKKKFENYDKLLRTGHLSFVRNRKEINELFKKYDTYRITTTSPINYGYDESVEGYHLGFAGELLDNGYAFYQNDGVVADIDFRFFPFHVVSSPQRESIFLYDNGKTYRIDRTDDKRLQKTEVMYVHLQKRKMEVKCDLNSQKFLIIPNAFIDYDRMLLESDYFWMSVTEDKDNYFDFKMEKTNSRKRDFTRFWHEPHKVKCLLYRLSSRWKK